MEQSKLLKILNLEYTSDIRVVYKAAKKYAIKVHPDQDPDKKYLWLEFEIAYNVIRKLSDSGLSFDRYTDLLESTPGGKQQRQGNAGNSANQSKQSQEPRKSQQQRSQRPTEKPARGSDINLRVKVTFDQIVYGCSLDVQIPVGSHMSNPNLQFVKINVTSTPIWTNQDGSISKKSLNAVFNKLIVVKWYGEKGRHGGLSGDLKITFDINVNKSKSIQDAISEHFRLRNEFVASYRFGGRSEDNAEPHREEAKPQERTRKESPGQSKARRPSESPKTKSQPKPNPAFNYKNWNYDQPPSAPIRENTLPNSSFRKGVGNSCIFFVIFILSTIYISHNVDKNNSWDASWSICDSANSINASILWDKFYSYKDPYKAAIYFDYFAKDDNASYDIATIESQLLRIQADSYMQTRSYAEDLVNAVAQNNTSIVNAMKNLKTECARIGQPWNE